MAYELKTKKNDADVDDFISSLPEEQKKDCVILSKLMSKITKDQPKMWGKKIVGFGSYHYKSKSGIEADWMLIGFSPRKTDISIYTMINLDDNQELLDGLNKPKHGRSCIYIKKVSDLDLAVLEKLLRKATKETKEMYG
jgi:hypothetical protein